MRPVHKHPRCRVRRIRGEQQRHVDDRPVTIVVTCPSWCARPRLPSAPVARPTKTPAPSASPPAAGCRLSSWPRRGPAGGPTSPSPTAPQPARRERLPAGRPPRRRPHGRAARRALRGRPGPARLPGIRWQRGRTAEPTGPPRGNSASPGSPETGREERSLRTPHAASPTTRRSPPRTCRPRPRTVHPLPTGVAEDRR